MMLPPSSDRQAPAAATLIPAPWRLAPVTACWLLAGLCLSTPAFGASAGEYRRLGLAYRQQERYPEAIAALKQAVALEPKNLSGQVLLGWTQHRAGQATAATDTLVQAFYLDPFQVPTLNALGIVYLVGEQLPAAIATHTWAAFLKPDNEIAFYNLSLAYERIRQYDFAIATAREAAKLEPNNPHPLVAEAIAHWGNRDPVLAQQSFRRAIALDARYAEAAFLNYLNEAGFSNAQIKTSKQVLETK